MATRKPNKQPAQPQCTAKHPNVPVLGAFENFLCELATHGGLTPSTDPTTQGDFGKIEKAVDQTSHGTANAALTFGDIVANPQYKIFIIIGGILLVVMLLKR